MNMNKAITEGISVVVKTRYEGEQSAPDLKKYVHSYHITIQNNNVFPVQLLRRYWLIMDSSLVAREVNGEGVIGQQPILDPGESHSYTSWCPLQTDIGKMRGSYTMVRLDTQDEFDVEVPEFKLIANSRLN